MTDEELHIRKDIQLRVRLLYMLFFLTGMVVFGRLIWVQWFSRSVKENAAQVEKKIFSEVELSAHRGGILSRHGEPFATSIFRYQVEFDFAAQGIDSLDLYHEQADSLAKLLAKFFPERSEREFRRMFHEEHAKNYLLTNPHDTTILRSESALGQWWDRVWGRENIVRTVYDTVRNHRPVAIFPRTVDYAEWQQLREYPLLNWNMGMVYRLVEADERIYPFGGLARRTIGRNLADGNGYGIEYAYSDKLRGKNGKALRQRIAHDFYGRVAGGIEEPVDGLDIETTLDAELQIMADTLLRKQLIAEEAMWGTTLVMKVSTGEILAMANLDRSPGGQCTERENRALKMALEPGSTFKLATTLALLDDAKMSPLKEYDSNDGRAVKIAKAKVQDAHRGDHEIALKRAIAGSSNIYFAQAVWDHYGKTGRKKQFTDYLENTLRLNAPMGLGQLGERTPKVISEGEWQKVRDPGIKLVKMAYGYRVEIAPIQMLTLYNAIANNGRMMAPMLIRRLSRNGEAVAEFQPRVLSEAICTPQTLGIVQECLEEVALTGTASRFFRDTTHVRVAAKTGTAQVTTPDAKDNKQYLASTVCYFPADNPRYTILTTIQTRYQAGHKYYGGPLAGSVVKELVDYITMHESRETPLAATRSYTPQRIKGGDMEQVAVVAKELDANNLHTSDTPWARVIKDDSTHTQRIERIDPSAGTVPDVRGMGLKEALFLLEKSGLRVEVQGSGAVYEQTIPAGQKIKSGQKIKINLR